MKNFSRTNNKQDDSLEIVVSFGKYMINKNLSVFDPWENRDSVKPPPKLKFPFPNHYYRYEPHNYLSYHHF